MGRLMGLSWISSTLGKFRNRTFGSSLLNCLAIRHKCRTEIRSNSTNASHLVASHPHHTNKKDSNKSHCLFYGASNGIGLEPYCIEFAQLTIHEAELMQQVNSFLCA